MLQPWFQTGLDAWMLTIEASSVIALRTAMFAVGSPNSGSEAIGMVGEKIASGFALNRMALAGTLGITPEAAISATLNHYREKVGANIERLTAQPRDARVRGPAE